MSVHRKPDSEKLKRGIAAALRKASLEVSREYRDKLQKKVRQRAAFYLWRDARYTYQADLGYRAMHARPRKKTLRRTAREFAATDVEKALEHGSSLAALEAETARKQVTRFAKEALVRSKASTTTTLDVYICYIGWTGRQQIPATHVLREKKLRKLLRRHVGLKHDRNRVTRERDWRGIRIAESKDAAQTAPSRPREIFADGVRYVREEDA